MSRALDNDFVIAYARKPDQAVIDRAVQFHQRVSNLLGASDYLTFLQGSYSNDTALADMNDVDVVAVRRDLRGTGSPLGMERWKALFVAIGERLQKEPGFRGRWTREDKCIRLHTDVRVDIVPAIVLGNNPSADPIVIFSFRTGREKKNWPNGHHENAMKKSRDTNGHFKQAVRLFKRWRTCHFGSRKVAPSYYLECLLYSLPDKLFAGDLASNFVELAREIGRRYPNPQAWSTRPLHSLVGGRPLLSSEEWDAKSFEEFRLKLASSLVHTERALLTADIASARQSWKAAFNGQ